MENSWQGPANPPPPPHPHHLILFAMVFNPQGYPPPAPALPLIRGSKTLAIAGSASRHDARTLSPQGKEEQNGDYTKEVRSLIQLWWQGSLTPVRKVLGLIPINVHSQCVRPYLPDNDKFGSKSLWR